MLFRAAISLLIAWLAASVAWAGGSGLNVIVVVNQRSTNSVELGNDYCELRGVPPQNLLRITNWTGGAINWTPTDFQADLLNPLLAMTAARGLRHQAQFVLLSMDVPYRVTDGSNVDSTTSALFYGFKTNSEPVEGIASCSLPDDSSNSYAYSELPFAEASPNTAPTNSFLAMMLTDTNLTAAEIVLRRAIAADDSYPTQTVYLAKTSDGARNVRFIEFDNAIFENQVVSNDSISRINSDDTAFTNLLGFLTGLASFSLQTNAFQPGAIADSLTSFGGYILENSGQAPMLAFLNSGAAGSYGTVVEPCNYTQKFPDPVDYFYQARGFSLAEAYYQSVLNPFQGLMVGEPLAAPFAHPGYADWTSLANGTVLAGQVSLTPYLTASATNLPLSRVDLFVDGTFYQTMTNLLPAAGNVLSVLLNGTTINYTVPTNVTVAVVSAGLADALNSNSNLTHVVAFPVGDRVELQSLDTFILGSNVTLTVGEAAGSAPLLTTHLSAARPDFLDTVATGYQFVTLNNAPLVGDWLQVTFLKTNGTPITLSVTNTVSGATIGTMAQNLVNQINSDPELQSADGLYASDFFDSDPYGQLTAQFFLYARTPGWPAAQILATWNASTNLVATPGGTNPFADNVSDLRPRDHLYISSGFVGLPVNYALDTTQIPDGHHALTAVGYEGSSVATQAHATRNVIIQNTSLTATLAALPAGSNAAFGQPLQFAVSANITNVAEIELVSTGGTVGCVTNQALGNFTVSSTFLGLGLHPFYAVVTDTAGHQYQTQTLWYRVIPPITLSLAGAPPFLSWPAIPGRLYDLESATNLVAGFQTLATISASNSIVQWPVANSGATTFYRVKLEP